MFPRNPGEMNNSCTGSAPDPSSSSEGAGDARLVMHQLVQKFACSVNVQEKVVQAISDIAENAHAQSVNRKRSSKQ